MTKFVIAGRSDCPYFAKSELLADKLAVNLSSFSIHKETVRPDAWPVWLEENCREHGFQWNTSPLIWRELTERGGRGALLGGYNEFCEYAKLYYNQEFEMSSVLAKDIAEENKLVKIKNENEARKEMEKKKPLNITITNPNSHLAYQLLAAMLKTDAVFDSERVKDGIILNAVGDCSEKTRGVLMELEDLAEGSLAGVKMVASIDACIKNTDLLLLLDNNNKKEDETRIQWINRNRERYTDYSKMLENYKGRMFISGPFATIAAYLIMKANGIPSSQILTTAAANENAGRGCIGRKLGLNASKIHRVLYYGSTLDDSETSLFSTNETTVQGIESAIYGPDNYHRELHEVLFNNDWRSKEFDIERRRIRAGPVSQCAAIVSVLKQWYASGACEQIVSCGVPPDPSTTLSCTYLCMPGKFTDGQFTPLDITLTEADKVKLIEVDRINKRDELISTLSEEAQAQFSEEEMLEKQRADAEALLEDEMPGALPPAAAAIPEEDET